jgi:hypothetical protein
MKGIIDVEFVISVMVFLSTISFVTIMIINSLPMLHYESISNDMRSEAYQLSNVLLYNFSGQEPYVLDMTKINNTEGLCINYENFRKLFSEDIVLNINYLDDGNTPLLSCEPSAKTLLKPKFTLERFATVGKKIVIMSISIIR